MYNLETIEIRDGKTIVHDVIIEKKSIVIS